MKPGDISHGDQIVREDDIPQDTLRHHVHACHQSRVPSFLQQKSCSCPRVLLKNQAQAQDIQM